MHRKESILNSFFLLQDQIGIFVCDKSFFMYLRKILLISNDF